jgi:hypothetical protein
MDGGRDFDAEAARLGPRGLELLKHAVAELLKPASPYLWPGDPEIEAERQALEAAIAAGHPVHLSAVLLTVLREEGKKAACALIPPALRGKAGKERPERVERERLIVELWRQFQRPKLSVEDNYSNLAARFNWYRKEIFPSQRHYKTAPPRGDDGWDDIFWRILMQVDAPMVSIKTLYKYLKRSANNL